MAEAYQTVFRAYSQVTRFYHDLNHIQNMIAGAYKYGKPSEIFDQDGFLTRPLYEAILFHDVVYDVIPKSVHSNEEMSAAFYSVYAQCEERPIDDWKQVNDMILATEHHFDGTVYDDYLTNLLLDVDLLSFTAEHDDFKDIQERIDMEFVLFFPEDYVISRRIDFLTDIYENQKLQYRVIDPSGALTEIAYKNLSHYLEI